MITERGEIDMVTRGRAYLDSLAGRRVTVVGLARSGVAAARLLRTAGAQVTGTDLKPLEALGRVAAELQALGVRLVTGPHARGAFDRTDLVVVSPGVPFHGDQLGPARARGMPIIGELELGWRALEAETIAITGTNGKTTTTALTGALLAEQPRPVLVAGNIGTPLAAHALGFPPDGLVVCEVSSFQLETTEAFQPRVAAVLNITPDHLDRHGSLAAYVDAKARIFANQTPADCTIVNADDEAAEAICPVAEICLRGAHNVENVLAAAACALWAGLAPEAIRRAIGRFRAVAHRIEFVRDRRGAQYYNDSKGTNVASTLKALESFSERILLIAGGKGKGQDFEPLATAARGRVGHVFLIGEDAPRLAAAFKEASVPLTRCPSLEAAVDAARRLAVPGDVVLLSPACASFDMFENFEHRGDVFKKLVERLD